jgi:hypothetical protein
MRHIFAVFVEVLKTASGVSVTQLSKADEPSWKGHLEAKIAPCPPGTSAFRLAYATSEKMMAEFSLMANHRTFDNRRNIQET